MCPIKVGIIGSGLAARVFHIPIIQAVPQLHLTKVLERSGNSIRQGFPELEVVHSLAEMFADDELELVVIATPNETHFDLARQCLEAGRHVVVDKPFTTNSTQARELIRIAQEHDRLLSVYQSRRWDGDFLTVSRLIRKGVLGKLVEYESHFDRFRSEIKSGTWRENGSEGSGMLFDLGSHLIDQATQLFGTPQSVWADIRIQREGGLADDEFELVLDYPGLKVSLKSGMLAREPDLRFLLHGSRGSFVKFGLDPQEAALKKGLKPGFPGWGEDKRETWGRINFDLDDLHLEGQVETLPGNYTGYYQNIAAALADGVKPAVDPAEALNTIRIIELAFQSSREKRTLPFSF